MKPLMLLLIVGFFPMGVQAQAKPELALVTLKTAGAIPEADRKIFEAALRKAATASATVLGAGKTAKALKKDKVSADCTTDTCGRAAARATGSRFILHASVSNSDEIYQVDLQLFDSTFARRSKESGECELCSADEVKTTLRDVFARFSKALAVPPPAAVVAEKSDYEITVETTPPGADVRIDGQLVGTSPITTGVTVGKHQVEVSKVGFASANREVNVLNAMTSLKLSLESSTPGVATSSGSGGEAGVGPSKRASTNSSVAYGLTFGGMVLTGLGTWLVMIDGEVTCPNLGIRQCPDVYNTNLPGVVSLGIGAGMVGAGITMLIQAHAAKTEQSVRVYVAPALGGGSFGLQGGF